MGLANATLHPLCQIKEEGFTHGEAETLDEKQQKSLPLDFSTGPDKVICLCWPLSWDKAWKFFPGTVFLVSRYLEDFSPSVFYSLPVDQIIQINTCLFLDFLLFFHTSGLYPQKAMSVWQNKAGKGMVALRVKWHGGNIQQSLKQTSLKQTSLTNPMAWDKTSLALCPGTCLQGTRWLGQNHSSKSTNRLSGARREVGKTQCHDPLGHTQEDRHGHHLGWAPWQWHHLGWL